MTEIVLTEGNTNVLDSVLKEEMQKSVKHFEHELVSIRTGRAHPSMVEDVKVECYGGETELALKNLASISTPEPRCIIVQPFDQTTLGDIDRALQNCDLGVTPVNDGTIIRIVLPEMSSARREDLIKILGKKLEDSRVSIRNVRKTYHNMIRDAEKGKKVSEDFAKRLDDLLQKTTDLFIKQVETLSEKKMRDLKA